MNRDYVAGNRESLERLRNFIARSSEDDLRHPMSDGWTVSAYLGHIAFFDRRVSRLIERWSRDAVGPSPIDVDTTNDAMKPAWLLLTPADAAAEAIAAAEEADAAVANLSDDQHNAIVTERAIKLDRAGHRHHHLSEFEALLA